VELLQLIQCRDAKRGCGRLKERLDLVVQSQVAAVETALAVGQRVGGGFHLSKVVVGPQVKLANQVQIVVQHLMEIPALLLRLCVNHRQMKADGTDVEPSHKDRFVLLVRRLHAAALIPG